MADIELSAQDKIEEYKRELAAEGETLDTVASDRLEKDLARMGVESSQIQDQYKIRRREGFPGFGFERQPQRTLSQILQRQEPPPAFFEGIPQAMQEAIARVNQQIVSDEPFVSPNAGRDVETKPLPGFQAEGGEGVLPPNQERDGFDQENFRESAYKQQQFFDEMRQAEKIVSEANKKDITDFTSVIVNLASSEELSNSQRSALDRLSTELNQRAEMGRPVTEEDLKNLQDDVRYRSAFNVIQNIAEDDPKILENVLGGLEILGAIPAFAPVGRTTQAIRAVLGPSTKAVPKTGRFRLTKQRTGQDPPTGILATSEGGRTVAYVQAVKTRPEPTRVPEGVVAGLRRVGQPGAKLPESTRTGVRGTVRPENLPSDRSLGGGRRGVVFAIPFSSDSEEQIEESRNLQNETLNFIIAREGFKPKPYDDVEQTSIGFGTKAEEGQQSITKQEAVEAAQEYLVNNVYPEIDFIQENGTRGLTENQVTAVSSLIYNVGLPKWLNSKSRQLLLDGKFEEFKKEAFTGPNAFLTREPKFLAGLKNRREIEAKLFDTPYVPLG